ncbi:MAG: hypothetical protein HC923_01990 [Myxococcales bacterium]|nr:hypothetical protein [Myxococcales bacterium]
MKVSLGTGAGLLGLGVLLFSVGQGQKRASAPTMTVNLAPHSVGFVVGGRF